MSKIRACKEKQMLVLTRKKGQAIVIAEAIEIVVLEVRGERVKLGIKSLSHN
jgi:carbon storage regulator CsrA